MNKVVSVPEDSKEASVEQQVENVEEEKKEENGENVEDRDRWNSRTAFILASIGSAIGLGNFLRFPYLVYKHGGVIFFVPYFIALLTVGIPMLLLELSLGQKFQRGNIGVFKSISPRAAGIGAGSVYSAIMIIAYYSVVLAWSLFYFAMSFASPLKWSEDGYDNV